MSKGIIKLLSLVFGALEIVAMVCLAIETRGYIVNHTGDAVKFTSAFLLFSTAFFGLYYILFGCKKQIGSHLYVWFMGLIVACDFAAIARSGSFPVSGTIAFAVSIAVYTVLCFAKDLGFVKSCVFSLVGLAAKIFIFTDYFIGKGNVSVPLSTGLLLAVISVFMVCAKYYDKAVRHSNDK